MASRKRISVPSDKRARLIKSLADLLAHRQEIQFAFIFGSFVEVHGSGQFGDIDVAVYLAPMEHPNPLAYAAELEAHFIETLSDLGLYLLPVEVLVLNDGPVSLQISLLKSPCLFLKQDEEAFTDFVEDTGARAMMANHAFRRQSLEEVLEG